MKILYIYVRLIYVRLKMNIAIRKLAMLEKEMIAREEAARLEGCSSCPVNYQLKSQITSLMDKIRAL